MNATKVGKETSAVVKFVDGLALKIDEKAAVCRAAGDVFLQVIAAETTNIILKESVRNYIAGSMPKE